MTHTLKELIKNNLTDTDLKINSRNTKILAMTCFWVKENFSAIIKHNGGKYHCYYDRTLEDIVINNA